MKRPLLPATNPSAQTAEPNRLRAFATLIPFPPASTRVTSPRLVFPISKPRTVTLLSIAGFKVTVAIIHHPNQG